MERCTRSAPFHPDYETHDVWPRYICQKTNTEKWTPTMRLRIDSVWLVLTEQVKSHAERDRSVLRVCLPKVKQVALFAFALFLWSVVLFFGQNDLKWRHGESIVRNTIRHKDCNGALAHLYAKRECTISGFARRSNQKNKPSMVLF